MPTLDDVGTYLAAQSTAFGILSGTTGNLARGLSLDASPAPDTLTVLYDTAGFVAAHAFSTGGAATAFEQPGLQILSRSTSYKTARDRADIAHDILDGLSASLPTATGTRYLSIDAAQRPFFIGRDDNERVLFSVNFNIRKDTT